MPLTISAQYGLVDQRTFFNNQVASKDLSSYYLLHRGEFAYNKSTSDGSPWGAVKRLENYDKGCVSTLYICFGPDGADPDFLVTYYETDRWYKAVQMVAAEGARNHGLLNISPDDFFDTTLTLPQSREEQRAVGAFFSRLDNLITLHQRKRIDHRKCFQQRYCPMPAAPPPRLAATLVADNRKPGGNMVSLMVCSDIHACIGHFQDAVVAARAEGPVDDVAGQS